jgi:D-methionine transport system ATP-binding protein
LIEFQRAAKRYGDAASPFALHPLELCIARADIFGVIGHSGAGKSTLLRLINLLERPTEGRVLVDGVDLATLDAAQLRARRRRIGMIFQHFNLLASATAAQNVEFPLRLDGTLDRAARERRVAALLDRVGLSAHAHKYPAQLSGGQKQRVGIARALATGPDLLLCDEATSALDPETTASVLDLLAQLQRELGLTIVLITHEMSVVRRICRNVAVLDAGHLVETGATLDVFLDPAHAVTRGFLRESGQAGGDGWTGAVDAGTRVLQLRIRGEATCAPWLSSIARDTGVDIGVLSAQVDRLQGEPFGRYTLALRGEALDAAQARLAQVADRVEVVEAPPR